MKTVYLDNAATTPVDPRVKEAMLPWLTDNFGNPSSVHKTGRAAKVMLEDTRDLFAEFAGAKPSEIYFTSGGTEANNFAIKGCAFNFLGKKNHIITTSIEHSAVLDTVEYLKTRFGFKITILKTNKSGEINYDELNNAISEETFLVSVMHSNNELGIINDVRNAVVETGGKNIAVHSDMVQSLGKVKINLHDTGVNFASFSSHKIYGPKGAGALYIKKDSPVDKYIHGGKQERDRRGGTENTASIAGFKKAIEILSAEMESDIKKYSEMKEKLVSELKNGFGNKIIFNSYTDERSLPNIMNISFDRNSVKIDTDTLLIKLDMNNIAVSSGSACTSGSVKPSHVLKAIGYDDNTAGSSLRISFGRFNEENDIYEFVKVLKEIIS
ncbi:MAG: aminotransferase, class V [Chlorobi bacterium OLB5]|nr:MAG: aminotransferase, class V [Chlorobi bacterium OLB5]